MVILNAILVHLSFLENLRREVLELASLSEGSMVKIGFSQREAAIYGRFISING